jgi:hypothetical protein
MLSTLSERSSLILVTNDLYKPWPCARDLKEWETCSAYSRDINQGHEMLLLGPYCGYQTTEQVLCQMRAEVAKRKDIRLKDGAFDVRRDQVPCGKDVISCIPPHT